MPNHPTKLSFNIYFLFCVGIVQVRINNWVLLSFCLPHKAHQIHNRGLIIEPECIDKCLQKLRPYHGILLMVCIHNFMHVLIKYCNNIKDFTVIPLAETVCKSLASC